MESKKTLENIYKSAVRFLLPLTLKESYQLIISEASKLVGSRYGSVFLNQGGMLKRVFSNFPTSSQITPRKKGFTYQAYKSRRIVVVTRDEFSKFHPNISKNIKSVILIPLSYRNRTFGVLALQSSKIKEISLEQMDTLRLLSWVASLAIRKAELYQVIKDALDARDLFISTAAHELKTPLTTITVYNELIYNRVMGGGMPEKKWAEGLSSQVYRLTKLINEFLQIDTIKIGDLRYEWNAVSLRDLINHSIRNFQIKYPNREIVFKDELDGKKDTVKADFDKLVQVLNNLTDNAVKFSPRRTVVEIALTLSSPFLVLKVIDRGRGISKKDMPNIFKKYYKGDVHGKPGMGIGLFLTRKIVEKHGGIINIYSKRKGGTIVEVLLPKI